MHFLLPSALLTVAAVVVGTYAAPSPSPSPAANPARETPIITATFYDPNYHDDGRARLRGPTAASSSASLSVMNPYTSSSVVNHHYNKAPPAQVQVNTGGAGQGTIMAIVDHYYGPNGEEEKVQYKHANEMDKDELDQIMAQIGSAKLSGQPSIPSHMSPPSSSVKHQYSHSPPPPPPPSPPKLAPSPSTASQTVSSLYNKPSLNPTSYASTSHGFSLPSLYKSSSNEVYSKPANAVPISSSPYRPAFSTIYKDPPSPYSSPSPPKTHYIKGPSDFLPPKEPHYASSYKEQNPLNSNAPKDLSFMRGPPYFVNDSPPPSHTPHKSISESLLAEGFKSFPPKGINSIIEHDDVSSFYSRPPQSTSSSYPPPPPPPPSSYSPPHGSHYSSIPPPPGYTAGPPTHASMEAMHQHHLNHPPPPSRHVVSSHEMQAHHHGHPPPGSSEFPLNGGKLYSSSVHLLKEEFPDTFKGHVKPGHVSSVPLTYSTPDINYAPPPSHTVHPNAFTSGYGYPSADEHKSPFSRPGAAKEYHPKPYGSSSPPSGGHSLSSLYEPLSFEEIYNNPKSHYASPPKTMFSGPKPSYGSSPPSHIYSHTYGSSMEYLRNPKSAGGSSGIYSTSSSPYGSPHHGGHPPLPKYKGPYRTVNLGPSGYPPYGYGYGYGKSPSSPLTNHLHHHHGKNSLLASSSNLLSDMLYWYKTRGGGWAKKPPMMKMTPYYKYKYSTISHAPVRMHPLQLENGPSEKYYRRPNRFSRYPFPLN